jgi:hypothetical protein
LFTNVAGKGAALIADTTASPIRSANLAGQLAGMVTSPEEEKATGAGGCVSTFKTLPCFCFLILIIAAAAGVIVHLSSSSAQV